MRFGYVWAFLEPALYVLVFVGFRTFISHRVPFGENGVVYLITAILTFRTAMALTRRTMGAIQANGALLTFPQVKTFDVIVARILLESITWTVMTCLFLGGLYFFTGMWAAHIPENFVVGFATTLFFGSAFGFFNATFVRIFPFWERILAIASFPLFFASGILFLPSSFPPEVLNWLWWNPYLHLVEWVRSGVYLDYTPFVSPLYVFGLSLSLLFVGLFLNKFYQHRMLQD
jgi:capsular polysaccharide transport system permease protein